MPSVATKIIERKLDRAQVQAGSGPIQPPTPQSKYHYRSPTADGIGINIPSLHIPASQVVPEFFSFKVFSKISLSEFQLKFSSLQNHLKFFNPGYFSGLGRGGSFL